MTLRVSLIRNILERLSKASYKREIGFSKRNREIDSLGMFLVVVPR